MDVLKKFTRILDKFKYPLLVFAFGLLLMLLPTGNISKNAMDSEIKLQEVLSEARGVGKSQVIISENGVVVVCSGADKASVRLDILRSVMSYTGFTSDKVTILKMND